MAFCPNCGAQAQGVFCPNCGAAIGSGGAPSGGGPSAPPPPSSAGLEDHVAAALCYLVGFITGILFLVWAPYNQSKNVRFHAFQSIFLNVAWFVVSFATVILPFGVRFLFSQLLTLAALVLWLFMMWKTYNRERIVLPVIGPIAEKQA